MSLLSERAPGLQVGGELGVVGTGAPFGVLIPVEPYWINFASEVLTRGAWSKPEVGIIVWPEMAYSHRMSLARVMGTLTQEQSAFCQRALATGRHN